MGVETGVVAGGTIALGALGFFAAFSQNANTDDLGPQGIDSFNVTQAKEGSVVPLVYGKRRINSNIIFHGNLKTKEIEPPSPKGGPPDISGAQGGTQYFIDAWHAICIGKIKTPIEKVFVNDKEEDVIAANEFFNDGTQNVFPPFAGPKANRIPGVAHIAYERWDLGINVSSAPTLHFVVEREMPNTIDFANLSNGSNPAAVIFDMLILAGEKASEIDIPSFNSAASFWSSKGYGINLIFSNQVKVFEAINKVLQMVDGVLVQGYDGRWRLNAFDENQAILATILQEDFNTFTLERKTWSQIPNDFAAKFVDESQRFTERSVIIKNEAAIELAGQKNRLSVDLSGFRDLSTASKRLTEIMKFRSTPALSFDFSTNLKYSELLPGDIVTLQNPDHGISSLTARILTVDNSALEKNEVRFSAIQLVENLFDDEFIEIGGTLQTLQDTEPVNLQHIKLFELPFTKIEGFSPAYLLLAAREKLIETEFSCLVSDNSSGDFSVAGVFTTFAQQGTLDESYPSTTKIDDIEGILYTPFQNDPEFASLTRTQLFKETRVAIIGNEMMAFEDITPELTNSFRLTGIIRGIFETPIESHASGSEIWISTIGNNVLRNISLDKFFVKILPRFLNKTLDPSLATAIQIDRSNKAMKPRKPTRLVATRSGNNIDIQIYPTTPGVDGAGSNPPSITDKSPPYDFDGDFEVNDGTSDLIVKQDSFMLTNAAAVTITVKSRLNGFISNSASVFVDIADGEYRGD